MFVSQNVLMTAIYQGPEIFHIRPKLCTECVGHFDVPQCVEICPVSCIPKDPNNEETKADLLIKYEKMVKKCQRA